MATIIDYHNKYILQEVNGNIKDAEQCCHHFGAAASPYAKGLLLPGEIVGLKLFESIKKTFVHSVVRADAAYNRLTDPLLKASNAHLKTQIDKLKSEFLPKMDSKIAALKKLPISPEDEDDSIMDSMVAALLNLPTSAKDKGDSKEAAN